MARSKAEKFAYEYHSEARVLFVKALPCCACGRRATPYAPSDNHHVLGGGTGRRGPYTAIVALCRDCHQRFHTVGKLSMLQAVGPLRVPLPPPKRGMMRCEQWEDAAAAVEALWLAQGDGPI